ncbi:MAG: HD family phosphohydrolase, partial [Anaerolineae bacterium CG03_land_8_20_14_0_80_58_20]
DASDGSINLLNNATGKLRQTIARGWPSEFSEAPIQPGEGLFGNVFASGNTRVTRDFANDPLTRPEMRSRLPAGWGGACIPIHSTEQTLGVMLIAIPGEREFSKEQVRLLNTLAEMTGNALQRASLLEETLRRLENMQALREVDQVIASSFDLRLILNTVLSHALTQLGVDAADVLSLNPIPQTLEYAAGFGFHTRGIERATSRLGKGHAGRAVLERQTVHVPNLPETGSNFLRASLLAGENFLEYYGVPLLSKGKVKGVLEVFHRSPLSPNPEWLELLETLAGQAAIAIDNAQLFENLQGANLELSLAYDATIEGWSRAMDLRDHETEGHTRRVTEMTMKLAQAFGVSDQELLHIRRGALLHDIGKMGVPDHILLKPDKLVDVEWALMQKHPQLAYEMLQPIQYLRESLDIPYCHHEKWDGTGYPQGLKGERIPLAARLFAIVDVYDALTSDRPYRKAWPKAKAIKYIRGLSGLQFDPQVVDKFMEMFGDEKSKV